MVFFARLRPTSSGVAPAPRRRPGSDAGFSAPKWPPGGALALPEGFPEAISGGRIRGPADPIGEARRSFPRSADRIRKRFGEYGAI